MDRNIFVVLSKSYCCEWHILQQKNNMKYLSLLLLSVTMLLTASAQTKESIYTTIANDLCKEIKENMAQLKQADDIQMELGMMMLPYFNKYEAEIKKALPNFDLTDPKEAQNLGMEVGKKLVGCPEFLTLITSNKELMKESAGVLKTSMTLNGTLQSVIAGDFTSINVKTASGKVEKIWWMEYFPGENKLLDGSLMNKVVTVKYTEKEIYNFTLKDYVKVKVLSGIE